MNHNILPISVFTERMATLRSSNSQLSFLGLPEDVLFHVYFWLSTSDILTLRSVNKMLYGLTQDSSVWLSLLRRLTLALPPALPFSSGSVGNKSMESLEFFVSRALRLEQNWREYNPPARHYPFNGHLRILSMRFLPGGKHMVTVSQNPLTSVETVIVWDMNFQGRRNHVAIAILNSETAVHKLQARYAMVDGQISLVIAFTRPPREGRTVIVATVLSVELLHTLSRLGPGTPAFIEFSKTVPNPFTKILDTRTRYPVGALSLSEIHGYPVLAAVHRPRAIAFFDLHSGARVLMKLASVPEYEDWRHSIWDIKILSSQRQVLVIRVLIGEVVTMHTNPLVFEIYDMPTESVEVEDSVPYERRLVLDYSVDGFYVSDGEASWNFRTHPDLHVPMLHRLGNSPPPPISIFVTTKSPRGFIQFLMIPEVLYDEQVPSTAISQFVYRLPVGRHAQFEWDEEEHAVILPGAYRSVVWMRSPRRQPLEGISAVRLAVYRTEGYTFSDSLDNGHLSNTFESTRLRSMVDASQDIFNDENMNVNEDSVPNGTFLESPRERAMKYPVIPADVADAMRNGVRCLQFDEWLGRLCVATTENNYVQVLDWSI
ncbi:hypothetical protein K439DRAFT_993078 [Ramaria rubella]|nr:hypothetical protein K439DRAFT_993078 [Ramaria rubella]